MASIAVPVSNHDADPNRWKALSVLALVSFIIVLDITVVNVALPDIAKDLHMGTTGLAWVVDGYVLTAGGLLLLGGRLADKLGRKRMFLTGLSIFGIASILSGAAVNEAMLISARFMQGAGEALAGPAALGLVALLFTDPKERTKALGIFGGVAGIGGTLGPVISGLLIAAGSWRLIFFVNIPVVLIASISVWKLVTESKSDLVPHAARPDYLGAVVSTLGLTGVVYGFLQAAGHPWGNFSVWAPLTTGVLLLALFVYIESRVDNPLIPLRFFSNRTRTAANGATVFFSSVFFTMFFLMTFYFQVIQGWSAIKTGLAYLPFGFAIGAAVGLSASLLHRVGIKATLVAGFLFYSAGIFWLGGLGVESSYLTRQMPALILMAIGSGFCFTSFQNAALHEVSQDDASLASGVQSAVQQIGAALGIAVLATVALRHASHAVAKGVDYRVASVDGYSLAFYIGAVIMLIGAGVVAVLFEKVELSPHTVGH